MDIQFDGGLVASCVRDYLGGLGDVAFSELVLLREMGQVANGCRQHRGHSNLLAQALRWFDYSGLRSRSDVVSSSHI